MTKTILLLGGSGQIGRSFLVEAAQSPYTVCAPSRAECDITDLQAIQKALTHYKPDYVVNSAGFTNVETAESQTEQAFRINVIGVENLAKGCKETETPLIQLSTDYVFDGNKGTSYIETDRCHPINVYGHTKWQAEQIITEELGEYIILRTSSVFSQYSSNFVTTMLQLEKTKSELSVIEDQTVSPTPADSIARAILEILQQFSPENSGIYHFAGSPAASRLDFARKIFEYAMLPEHRPVILPITAHEYGALAIRPTHSALTCKHIQNTFNIAAPDWKASLRSLCQTLTQATLV